MGWKLFDAATRVLICGVAVVLLTALAIPELTRLAFDDEDDIRTLWAPMISALVVSCLYAFLLRPQFKKFKNPKGGAEKWFLCTFVSIATIIVVDITLDLEDSELNWLEAAINAAIMTMSQFATLEWQLLELEFGKQPEE